MSPTFYIFAYMTFFKILFPIYFLFPNCPYWNWPHLLPFLLQPCRPHGFRHGGDADGGCIHGLYHSSWLPWKARYFRVSLCLKNHIGLSTCASFYKHDISNILIIYQIIICEHTIHQWINKSGKTWIYKQHIYYQSTFQVY